MNANKITPKELLKARRPERFSDSVVLEIPELHTSIFEYHLDTLTNREQSREFENFARKLAQKTVCPNLLPQTGPTGGGDSKVDSETFPVADSLAFAWLIGEPKEASEDRWAFAFSAKKQWQSKLRSDIAKVVATNRNYKKAFFVTNQFVRDKTRGEFEDSLKNEHKIDVRILDRSWIVEQVFEKGHIDIAIKELGVSPSLRREVKVGPVDYQKTLLLQELENRINKACEEKSQSLSFVDDCLEAAKVIASLERQKTEVDSAMDRARRAAQAFGTDRQRLHIAYQSAWIAYWWYEDYSVFNEQYAIVQSLAAGCRNVYDFELLHTLWNLKFTSIKLGAHPFDQREFEQQTNFLESELTRLAADEERPSTAYHADGLRIMMLIRQQVDGNAKPAFKEMSELIETCSGLAGFPFDSFADVLREIGKSMASVEGFSELFESLVQATKQRRGEVASARLLLDRAKQLLQADEPVEAIRVIGRCLVDLYKHESRKEMILALYLAATGYQKIGLLYAARGSMLTAASIATNYLWDHDRPIPPQAACYNRIKWLECELGRIPQALDWHQTEIAIREALRAAGYIGPDLSNEQSHFDALLAINFLRSDIGQLKLLTKLPSTLNALQLFDSSLALRYSLGDVESVRNELKKQVNEDLDPDKMFAAMRDQAIDLTLPDQPVYGEGQKVKLQTNILGCKVDVEVANNLCCLNLGESVIAALEAMLATGLADRVFAVEPQMQIVVEGSDITKNVFDFEFDDESLDPKMVVRCNLQKLSQTDQDVQSHIPQQMFALIAQLLARVFPPQELETTLETWFRDDKAIHRAINFTSSFVPIYNVLGASPKTAISNWIDAKSAECPLSRSVTWDDEYRKREAIPVDRESDSINGLSLGVKNPPVAGIEQIGTTNHRNLKTISIIRDNLWEKAGWNGTLFVADESFGFPLLLGFWFRNKQAAKAIFDDWRKAVGSVDTDNKIRVSVITGFDAANPYAYRVVVGSGDFSLAGRNGLVLLKSRVNQMNPTNHDNLDRFVRCFEKTKQFGLTFATDDERCDGPMPDFDSVIQKDQFDVVKAWTIGIDNPLVSAIQVDDDVIIPASESNAPIKETQAAIKRMHQQHASNKIQESVIERRKRWKDLKRKTKSRRDRN